MGANTKIEWAHHTFNPWIGCSKVSAGCANCYAEEMMDKRYGRAKWGDGGTRVRTSEANWRKPLQWDKAAAAAGERHRVFCASLADVFEDRPELDAWRDDLFRLITDTPNLDWLLLTKRPENVIRLSDVAIQYNDTTLVPIVETIPNLWIGTSVENQEQADKRILELLKVPAKVRFLSCEPMLGPVDLSKSIKPTTEDVGDYYQQFDDDAWTCDRCGGDGVIEYDDAPEEWGEDCPSLKNHLIPCRQCGEIEYHRQQAVGCYMLKKSIHWVIVGGESGHSARPMHPDWARSLRDQCLAAGVPFLFKQWGEWAVVPSYKSVNDRISHNEDVLMCVEQGPLPISSMPYRGRFLMRRVGKHAAGRELDGRTWSEVPEVQENSFPMLE